MLLAEHNGGVIFRRGTAQKNEDEIIKGDRKARGGSVFEALANLPPPPPSQ